MTKPFTLILVMASVILSACGDKSPNVQPSVKQQSTQNKQHTKDKIETNTTPDMAQELLDKGNKFWADNKPELAEAEFRKATQQYPESAKAFARLAGLLLTQNKTSESIPAYQDAISLDPENPKLFAALSIAYLHHQKFDMAKAMADQALELDPEMKQVKKLNEYIEKKQEVIKQANQVTPDTIKPDDVVHNPANHN